MKLDSAFRERAAEMIEVPQETLRRRTRRDFLVFGASALGVLAAGRSWRHDGWLANKALRFDDDVAEALYSPNRLVPTYKKSQITPLRNNYNGATPGPGYLPAWHLTLDGLSSGLAVSLDIRTLLAHHQIHDQITRLVCVEGWSTVAWWAGLKFDDLLQAYPPVSEAKWARLESSVNLDSSGNPDPVFRVD